MKQIALVFILAILATACSDSEESVLCDNEVSYGETITAEAGKCYSFSDGTELWVAEIRNEFCPCDANCFWEGQLVLQIGWRLSTGETLDYVYNGAGDVMTNEELPSGMVLSHDPLSVVFEVPCSNSNPSPTILSVGISVEK